MTTPPLTPAEHRAAAENNLNALRALAPGSPAYSARALTAITHVLIGISDGLDTLASYLEPPPVPDIPGLPPGWRLTAEQLQAGQPGYGGYILEIPGREPVSNRHRWSTWGGAIDAGCKAAEKIAAQMPELPDSPPDYHTHPDNPGHSHPGGSEPHEHGTAYAYPQKPPADCADGTDRRR